MADSKIVARVLLRHCWKKWLNASAAAGLICSVEGEGTAQGNGSKGSGPWTPKSKTSPDRGASQPPVMKPSAKLLKTAPVPVLVARQPCLGPSQRTIVRHLHELLFNSGGPRCVPHDLSPLQVQRHVDVNNSWQIHMTKDFFSIVSILVMKSRFSCGIPTQVPSGFR